MSCELHEKGCYEKKTVFWLFNNSSSMPDSSIALNKTKLAWFALLFCILEYLIFVVVFVISSFLHDSILSLFDGRPGTTVFILHIVSCLIGLSISKKIAYRFLKYDPAAFLEPGQLTRGIGVFLIVTIGFALTGIWNKSDDQGIATTFIYLPIGASLAFIGWSFFAKRVVHKEPKPEVAKKEPEPVVVNPYPGYVMPTGDDGMLYFTSHGTSRWLSDREKNEATCFALEEDVINELDFQGLWLGGGFFDHMEGNLLSMAPPGQGKGAALIIPNLLWKRDYEHSFVVFDPKGTNACITARFQKEAGQKVIIIDPMGLQKLSNATHNIPAACFNPLDFIKDDLFNGSKKIVHLLLPDDPKAEGYWIADARNIMQLIIQYIVLNPGFKENQRNLITLYQLMLSADYTQLLTDIIKCPTIDENTTHKAAGFLQMMSVTPKMLGGIRTIANSALDWIGNPALTEVLKKSDFSPAQIDKGGMTIYICQPLQDQESFGIFSRLIIGSLFRENTRPTASAKAWVYYLLDEFPTMGNFPEVVKNLATAREYKMRIWIFTQSLSQLDRIYGVETRNDICGTATIVQSFGITDIVSQEYMSKRAGDTTGFYNTESTQSGSSTSKTRNTGTTHTTGSSEGGSSSSTSTNYGDSYTSGSSDGYNINQNFINRPLIYPSELQSDPHIITITADMGPMRLVKWQYYQDAWVPCSDYFRGIFRDGRADANPNFKQTGRIAENSETGSDSWNELN